MGHTLNFKIIRKASRKVSNGTWEQIGTNTWANAFQFILFHLLFLDNTNVFKY